MISLKMSTKNRSQKLRGGKLLLIYSKTMTKGWTSPCHLPLSQRMYTGIGTTGAKLLPTPRHVLPALSQMLRAGGQRGRETQRALTSGRTARRPAG